MLGMSGMRVLKFQMNKCSGQLDQSLVKGIIGSRSATLQPKMLQYIMRLVIPLRVETVEITEITGIECGSVSRTKRCHESLHAFGLIHAMCLFHPRKRTKHGSQTQRQEISEKAGVSEVSRILSLTLWASSSGKFCLKCEPRLDPPKFRINNINYAPSPLTSKRVRLMMKDYLRKRCNRLDDTRLGFAPLG